MKNQNEIRNGNGKRRVSVLAGLLAVSLVLPQAAFAATPYEEAVAKYAGPPTTAEQKAERILSDYGATSVQYALIDNGKIITSKTKGVYSKTENRAASADTMYGIGSVSKVVTTAIVMKLVDEGRVQLDQPVTHYLPDFRMEDSRYKDITVGMLLNHSSGLMGTTSKNAFLFNDTSTEVHDGFLEALSKQSLKADPGAFSVYCNDGFVLAELVAERVTGMTFTQLMHSYITEPLNLKNTKTPQDSFDRNNLAKTYLAGVQKELPVDTLGIIGTGGIYSTAEDMCRFMEIFMKGSKSSVLSEKSAQRMGQKEFAKGIWTDKEKPNADGFGLGWDGVALAGFAADDMQALYKGGDTFFYHTSIVVLPEENMAAAVLSSGGASVFNQYLAEQLLRDRLKETGRLPEKKENGSDAAASKLPSAPVGEPMPVSLMEHSGFYGNAGGVMKVEVTALGGVSLTIPGNKDYKEAYTYLPGSAKSADGACFVDATGLVQVSFVKETNGKTYLKVAGPQILAGLGVSEMSFYTAQRLEPSVVSKEIQDAWNQRNGKKYYQLNEKYTSALYLVQQPAFTIHVMSELPGYVGSSVMSGADTTKTVVQLPYTAGRDLQELKLYQMDGMEYLTNHSDVAVCQDFVEEIDGTQHFTYEIGRNGYAVWKTMGNQAGRKMTVTLPQKGAFFVYDANGVCVNASSVSGVNTIALPVGGSVCFAGDVGQKFEIELERFADVTKSDWAYEAVNFVADKGLFAGTGANRFSPEEPMTQEMLSIILKKMDAQADVSTLTQKTKNMTREQLVVALYHSAKSMGLPVATEGMAIREFSDGQQVSQSAQDAVRWAIGSGLISGKPGTGEVLRIDPQGKATRAEVAQVLMKFFQLEK